MDEGTPRITVGDLRTDVDLGEVDVDRGRDVNALVDRLRALARPGKPVVVHACPQMLAHTLYKVGDLARGWIILASVRDEEPHG